MNIAIINTLAKSDSTGKIAYGYQQYLKNEGHNAYIFYGRDDELVKPEERDIIRIGNNVDLYTHALKARIFGMQGAYSTWPTHELIRKFKQFNIEAVCLLNLHGYYLNMEILFKYLGEEKIPCEYVMLDEYPFLGKCTYAFDCDKFKTECGKCPRLNDYPKSIIDKSRDMFLLKKRVYSYAPQCVFVGIEYTVKRAKTSAITRNSKFRIADEAIDVQFYYPRDTKDFRNELGIPEKNKVIVTVTPYPNDRKGGKYFLEAARELEDIEDITFVHVGFVADTNICPANYIPIGYVKDQDLLCKFYSLADLFVHTSTAETVPAAIIEALACGSPVLGFNASGIPYSTDAEHGVFVEPGNVREMKEVILNVQKKDEKIIKSCREYALNRYDSKVYYKKLFQYIVEA